VAKVFYDQSWMGYGAVGGLQAGAIAAAVGFVLFAAVHWVGRRNGWHHGRELTVGYLLTVAVAGGGDMWNLLYFSLAPVGDSIQLLKTKLAQVHDPDSIGLRVLCEFLGAAFGTYVSWGIFSGDWRARLAGLRK
jgi:hypothetical protein